MQYRRDFQCDGLIESGGLKYLELESPVFFTFKTADPRMPKREASYALKQEFLRGLEQLAASHPRSVVFYSNHDLTPSAQRDIIRKVEGRFEVAFQGRKELEQCFSDHPHLLWRYFGWSPFVQCYHSEDATGLQDALLGDLLVPGVPIERVLHPAIAGVTETHGIRARIVGKPGAGKSVALVQMLRRLPDTEVVILTSLDDQETWSHLQQILYQPNPRLAIVVDDLHEHITRPSLLRSIAHWARQKGPNVSIFVTYRTTEREVVEQAIGPRQWNTWGFTEVDLDEPPIQFIKDVIAITCEALGIESKEQNQQELAEDVARVENTPALAVSILQLYQNMVLSRGFYPFGIAAEHRIQDWGHAFAMLVRNSRTPEITLLRAVSALFACGVHPVPVEPVKEICRALGGIAFADLDLALGRLKEARWLKTDDHRISAHEIQISPEVTGLVTDREASPWLKQFQASVENDNFPALKVYRTKLLLGLSNLYWRLEKIDEVFALSKTILGNDPGNLRALHNLAICDIRKGKVDTGIARLREALAISKCYVESWEALYLALLRAGRRDEARQLIDEFTSTPRKTVDELHFAAFGYRNVGEIKRAAEFAAHLFDVEPSGMAVAMLAECTALSGETEEALRLLEDAKGVWPDQGPIYSVEASVLLRMNRKQEALNAAEKARAFSPNDPDNHVVHGFMLMEMGRDTDAAHSIQQALRIFPTYPALLALKGMQYEHAGQHDRAVGSLRNALEYPEYIGPVILGNAFLDFGSALLAKGNTSEAQEAFARAQEHGIPSWFCQLHRARILRDFLHAGTEAIAILEDAISQPEARETVWIELANLYVESEGTKVAVEKLLGIASIFPQGFEVRMRLGAALDSIDAHDEALKAFHVARILEPESASALNRLAIQLFHLKKYAEALPICNELLRLQPEEAEAHRTLGLCLRYLGRQEEAITAFDEALKRDKDNHRAMYNKAESLKSLKQWEAALLCYEQAHRTGQYEPSSHELAQRAICLAELGRINEAIRLFEDAICKDPNSSTAYHNLGLTFAKADRHDRALECYEMALKFKPDFRAAWLEKARCLMSLKKYKAAGEALGQATEFRPSDELGRANRAGDPESYLANLVHASELSEELLEAAPKVAEVLLVCAKLKYSTGWNWDAADLCSKLLQEQPRNVEVLLLKTRALNRLSRQLSPESSNERPRINSEALECAKLARSINSCIGEALLQEATSLAFLGRNEEAVATFQSALSLPPRSVEDWTMVGFALGIIGEYTHSLRACEEGLSVDPRNIEALRGKALALRMLKRPDEAKATVDVAKALDPKNEELVSLEAVLLETESTSLFESGDAEGARGALAEALKLKENDASLHVKYATLSTGEDAKKHLRRAIELEPNLGVAHLSLGILEGRDGKTEAAIEELFKATALMPEDPYAHINLAGALHAGARDEEARTELQRALSLNPSPHMRHQIARILSFLGDVQIADEQRKLVVERVGSSREEHERMVGHLLQVGDLDGVLVHSKKVIELAPSDADAHRAHANFCSFSHLNDEADYHYLEALTIDDKSVQCHGDYACHLSRTGRIGEARKQLECMWGLLMETNAADISQWTSLLNVAYEIGDLVPIARILIDILPKARGQQDKLYKDLLERADIIRGELQSQANQVGQTTKASSLLHSLAGMLDAAREKVSEARISFRTASTVPKENRISEAVLNWCILLLSTDEKLGDQYISEIDEAIVCLKETAASFTESEKIAKSDQLLRQLKNLKERLSVDSS